MKICRVDYVDFQQDYSPAIFTTTMHAGVYCRRGGYIFQVSVFDIAGKKRMQLPLNATPFEMATNDFPPGAYFVKMENLESGETLKYLCQKISNFMRKTLFPVLALFSLAYLFSCQNEKPQAPALPVVESAKYKQKAGADCDKPDTLQQDCAVVDLSWPTVKTGNPALQSAVSAWTNKFLTEMLNTRDTLPESTVEAATKSFLQAYAEWKKETPDFLGSFYAQSWDSLLLNNGKHLTLFMTGEIYTGGAHGGHLANIATFNAQSGARLSWTDLVSDTAAVKKLAEKKFREVRAEDFKPLEDGTPGFDFDDTFVFKLADNYGLTDKGIYLFYVPYEVAPYAFGETEFVLSFEELGALYKKP